ncbi:receptor-type tyrosine-protein phosphatase T-like isoform X1 [Biomphalaria pfeifferi]|uniref:protein-tyrosine-phosphatase n=1 Tax=Biomphalaria pfeifferi TaxID=112525 RepID=A0AAD8CCT6_BIOPF|nr:receptor-type tyrosine-protein phosphatase T-like isoform X1 [Biomphalaria pfeifferi]
MTGWYFGLLVLFCTNKSIVRSFSCDSKWFGLDCRFRCHCTRNDCKADGSCKEDARCDTGWFGHKCQYIDIMQSAKVMVPVHDSSRYWSDGNDKSCFPYRHLKNVELQLDQLYPFSWIRIVVNNTNVLTKVLLGFKVNDTSLRCTRQKVYLVDNKTIDIKCQDHIVTQAVLLEGDIVTSLCSIYISGGRNVAIRGKTNSSSSNNHQNAVDGSRENKFSKGSCSHSATDDTEPSWELSFGVPMLVDRFVLYNRGDCCSKRLQSFQLSTKDFSGVNYFHYTGPNETKLVYTVLPERRLDIDFIKIQATYVDKGEVILSLCEVEVYGDCPPTRWGLDCDQDCDSQCPNTCQVNDGTCDTGCIGYDNPPYCTNKCPKGKWGYNCENDCQANCYGKCCDIFSGYCDQGCLGFTDPPDCTKVCNSGQYGKNCADSCPANCKNTRCNASTGECFECDDGYSGKFCEDLCPDGRWGRNCSETCDIKCFQACHYKSGKCTFGCLGYYDPPGCRKSCLPEVFGKNCNSTCSENCVDKKCNSTTGECFACNKGYTGNTCSREQQTAKLNEKNDTAIYAGITIILILLISIIIIIIVLIRRKRQHTESRPLRMQTEKETRMSFVKYKDNDVELDKQENTDMDATYQNQDTYLSKNTSIPVYSLYNFIASHSTDFYKTQFQSVPTATAVSLQSGQNQENKNKNRYKNICPYEHNRVKLKINTSKSESDYINASYVNGFSCTEIFIAAQGPHKAVLTDFIRMLWEQSVEKVVMLTKLAENGKMKCEQYWPDDGSIRFGDIKVTLMSTQNFADFTIRSIQLSKKGDNRLALTHYHYLGWPDKSVPQNPWSLAQFHHIVSMTPTAKPILVHCSAGAGRTGCYIALHNILRQAEMTGSADFLQTLIKLRQDRMFMIQTAEQYEFLHIITLVAYTCLERYCTALQFSDTFKLIQEQTGQERIKMEWATLDKMSKYLNQKSETTDNQIVEADVYQNVQKASDDSKNRFSSIIPKDQYRPILRQETGDDSDYINAVLVPSFKRRNQYILTQLPLPKTVIDFWRLVVQYKISLIVAFQVNEMDTDVTMGKYLPNDISIKCSAYEVENVSSKRTQLWEEQILQIKVKQKSFMPETQNVIHLKCLISDLKDCNRMSSFIKQIKSFTSSEGRVIFMCRDGATYSGMACVLTILMDCLDQMSWFTIPGVLGTVKTIRPEVIPSLDDYLLLHKILHHYIELSFHYNTVKYEFQSPCSSQENLIQAGDRTSDDIYANL